MKKKLVVNLAMIGERPTGLGVYSLVCAGIAEKFDSVVICNGAYTRFNLCRIASPSEIAIGGGRFAAVRRFFWLRRVKLGAEAVVYSPTHHGLPRARGQIITIHDLICLRFPRQHLVQFLYFKYILPSIVKRCAAVFTVSETSKNDIIQNYDVEPDRVFVVPNSIDSTRFFPSVEVPVSDYLLMVGARYSHKNVVEVLENSELWSSRYKLVVTSCSGRYREELDKLIAKLGIESAVQFHDYVDDEKLLGLYQNCAALIYPSLWEGFGIPPLEALACGRPVIASDIPVHREVLAGAAIYVKLGQASSWRHALDALADADGCEVRRVAGHDRVSYFSRENSLSKLREALLKVNSGLEEL